MQIPLSAQNANIAGNGNILPFLGAGHSRRVYSFAQIVRLLRLGGEPRTQIGYLRDLHEQWGLPLPINPRRWKGRLQAGAASISRASKWCAVEVDGWANTRRAQADETASVAASPGARQRMQAAALRLGQGNRA